MKQEPLIRVGWREWAALPDLGIGRIKAKLDSGARSSAFHTSRSERYTQAGKPWVAFAIQLRRHFDRLTWAEAEVVDERPVIDTGGQISLRPFIRSRLKIGERIWEIEINLTDRRAMLFPMLIGRTAMYGRLMVDPAASFLLGGRAEDESDIEHRSPR